MPIIRTIEAVAGSRNAVNDGNLLGSRSQGDLIVAAGTATVRTNHPAVK